MTPAFWIWVAIDVAVIGWLFVKVIGEDRADDGFVERRRDLIGSNDEVRRQYYSDSVTPIRPMTDDESKPFMCDEESHPHPKDAA